MWALKSSKRALLSLFKPSQAVNGLFGPIKLEIVEKTYHKHIYEQKIHPNSKVWAQESP